MSEIVVDYPDLIKAYQAKLSGLLNELITAEAKFNASAGVIKKLDEKILKLEEENKKLQKSNSRSNKRTEQKTEAVIDYN
jgi:Skp family chaperone for outer membrane proteins